MLKIKFYILIISILCSNCYTQTWTLVTSGINSGYLICVSSVDSNVCWASSVTGYIIRTTNGGINWVNVGGGVFGSIPVFTICAVSSTIAVASSGSSIYRTTNGGANWTSVFNQNGGMVCGILRNESGILFTYGQPVGGRWSLWKSTNDGASWDSTGIYVPQTDGEITNIQSMYFKGNKIWFGNRNTSPLRIYYSTNLGSTWQYGTVNSTSTLIYHIGFNDANTGFASVAGPFTYKTTDGGATWSDVTLPGNNFWAGFNSLAGRFWYSSDVNLYFSSNNGANFSMQSTTGVTINSTNFNLTGSRITGWAVGDSGAVWKYIENGVISSIQNGNINTLGFILSQNYPNPFNPVTTIYYSAPELSNVKLTVYDVLGREVTTLINKQMQPGNYSIKWDASDFPGGVYLYRIISGKYSETKKMILIK